jgi:RNA polymerase sigma factor (sigma-70 family)
MVATADEFIPTRQSLLVRLKNWDDQASWKDFFETYWRLIYSVARKAGLSDAEAQEVVQETVISVAKQMPTFHYDPALGSFKAWLMQITRRRITDQFRRKHYQAGAQRRLKEEPLDTTVIDQYADPASLDLETVWNEEWEKRLFEAALERVKGRVPALQYQTFHLHVIKEVPARSVAQRLGLKLPQVYFAKCKISALIRKEVARIETKGL